MLESEENFEKFRCEELHFWKRYRIYKISGATNDQRTENLKKSKNNSCSECKRHINSRLFFRRMPVLPSGVSLRR